MKKNIFKWKMMYLFIMMSFTFVLVADNLDLPVVYDESKLEVIDWKYSKTNVDLDKDSKVDILLTYYKIIDDKVFVEYVPYLNNGNKN